MISAKAQRFKWSPAKGGFHPLLAHDHADDSQRGGDVVRRSLKCFAINLSTFQRISFPHLPWDGIKNRIQEALFSNLSTPPEEVLCPQGSRDFMRSASQHPARKMRNKSGTSMEQTFRVGTEQGSLRPVAGKPLMRMDFPRSEIAHFLQFHNVYIPPKVAF